MTDRQLRCFLALYETLNFSVAARQLFLTQPTLSYQIRTLEEELGTPLFVRTTCRVEPTQAGQLFAEFAQSTRKGYEAFQAALAAGQRQREKLVLQVPATMAARDPLYHDLLLALSRELPDCDLEVVTDSTFRPPEEVLQSGVDALVAQRAAVEADIALTKLHLEMATVRAPFDGRVISLKISVGQFASAMRPIFTLIDTRHWYVIANFRETDLKNIRSGTPATIRLMSDSGKTFEGKVDSIGYGVLPDDGGLVLGGLPKVSRSINWVRVAQRFPVKIMVLSLIHI